MLNLKKRNEGFTIVETLIVLAIAGLIIVIVLLAVPALQRSSRNTNIKSDASAIEAGINEFESNNTGNVPDTFTNTNGSLAITKTGLAGAVVATAKVQGSDTVSKVAAAPATLTGGAIDIVVGTRCDGTASARATSVYYPIETSGATSVGCLDS